MKPTTHTDPLRLFFALTFLFSWVIWVPMALDHYALLPFRLDPGFVLVARLLGTFGPAAAASVVVRAGGRPALGTLWGKLKIWRVGWVWYGLSMLAFPALVILVAWVYPNLPYQPVSAGSILAVMVILTLSVLGEEIGWRGFALPYLQKRWSALNASLLLGTIHTIWHLPFWIVLGELESFGPGYWFLSWVWILAITIYITWIVNNTGSLLMAFLFHWSLNLLTVGFLPITTVVPAYIILIVLAWILVLGIISAYGPRRLTHLQTQELMS